MKILITGGAGYIGSVVSLMLYEAGYSDIVVIDDLSTGYKENILPIAKFYNLSTQDKHAVESVFKENQDIKGIIHFAANIEVGESVVDPQKYYYNNVFGSLNLIDVARKYNVEAFIFSSTAAVYGIPEVIPILETSPTKPINPYGVTKLQVEQILDSYNKAFGFKYCALRYFNACGSYKHLGERHNPETHLIPNAIRAVTGKKSVFTLFGKDYDTLDGTPIRDYIAVEDLGSAHILALEALFNHKFPSNIFNVGTGTGYSVQEVLNTIERISGKSINTEIHPRRPGDPAKLVACSDKIKLLLGWKPKNNINDIIQSAWEYHSKE